MLLIHTERNLFQVLENVKQTPLKEVWFYTEGWMFLKGNPSRAIEAYLPYLVIYYLEVRHIYYRDFSCN